MRPSACPPGQMGNSEVGHLNLGAGFRVLQDLPRISAAIADGSFFDNAALNAACLPGRASGGASLHLMGLVGPGGVHAVDEHLVAMVELAHRSGLPPERVLLPRLHRWSRHAAAFGGRVPPRARDAIRRGARVIATVTGRYLGDGPRPALGSDEARLRRDRPRRRASAPRPPQRPSPTRMQRDEGDEFIQPTVIADVAPMEPGDGVVHLNFRADRARQLTPRAGPAGLRSVRARRCRRVRRHDPDRVPGARRAAGGGRLPAARDRLAGGAPVAPREAAAPRRRDREVRPRHVLLQRRCRGAVSRRGPHPRAVQSRGADLRPRAGDERRTDHRRAGRGPRPARARLHRRQLRERGHGRSHRGVGGRGRGRRTSSTGAWGACRARHSARVRPLVITADHGNIEEMRDEPASPRPSTRPRRSRSSSCPRSMPAHGFATASWPMWRRPSASSSASRPGPEMTGRSLIG